MKQTTDDIDDDNLKNKSRTKTYTVKHNNA